MNKDIVLIADYHPENIEFRWFTAATGEERTGKYSTTRAGILRQVEQAAGELERGGRIVWIMESTTVWGVKDLFSVLWAHGFVFSLGFALACGPGDEGGA